MYYESFMGIANDAPLAAYCASVPVTCQAVAASPPF